jgi:hypothetical protein
VLLDRAVVGLNDVVGRQDSAHGVHNVQGPNFSILLMTLKIRKN